jgi:tetratricopeptide (TPR) repeat protein
LERSVTRSSTSFSPAAISWQSSLDRLLLWPIRLVLLGLMVLSPWYYGSVLWDTQVWLLLASLLGGLLSLLYAVLSGLLGTRRYAPSWLVLIPCLLAVFASWQAKPSFPYVPPPAGPPSIALQRQYLADQLPQDSALGLGSSSTDDPAQGVGPLSVSIDRLHSTAGRGGLILAALAMWMASVSITDRRSALVLLISLITVGIAMGFLGLFQNLSVGRFRLLDAQRGNPFGTFVSKNSGGGFMLICLAASAGLLLHLLQRRHTAAQSSRYRYPATNPLGQFRRWLERYMAQLGSEHMATILTFGLLFVAVLASYCRSAAVGALAATLVCGTLAINRRTSFGTWLGIAAVISLILGLLSFLELTQPVYDRLQTMVEADEVERDGRWQVWSFAWNALLAFGWAGSGLGTFQFAYLPYQAATGSSWYYRAESIFWQSVCDLGWLGGLAMLVGLLLALRACLQLLAQRRSRIGWGVGLAGLFMLISLSVHGLFDFSLTLPGLFLPAAGLMGGILGLRTAQRQPLPDSDDEVSFKSVSGNRRSESGRSRRSSRHPSISAPTGSVRSSSLESSAAPEVGVTSARHLGRSQSSPKAVGIERPALLVCLAGWGVLAVGGWLAWQSIPAMQAMGAGYRWAETVRQLDNGPPRSMAELDELQTRLEAEIDRLPPQATLLRLRAELLLQKFRSVQHQRLVDRLGSSDEAWNLSSPLFFRMVSISPPSPERRQLVRLLEPDAEQQGWLEEARQNLWQAVQLSPLDWRIQWGLTLVDDSLDAGRILAQLSRLQRIGNHDPQLQFQAGLLAQTLQQRDLSQDFWRQALRLRRSLASRLIGLLTDEELADETFDVSIFPDDPSLLLHLARTKFSDPKFDTTRQRLLDQAERLSAQLSTRKGDQSLVLADLAAARGDVEDEVRHLEVVVKRRPLELQLRVRLANRLIDLGQLQAARQQLATCLGQSNNDRAVLALQRRLDGDPGPRGGR